MVPRCPSSLGWRPAASFTLTPFLYPPVLRPRFVSALADQAERPESRLNPGPDDYASPTFADRAEMTLYAGRGGNGCVSFLREAYLPEGPPNGGDGGAGGSIYIQAAHGETSLHKIARRRFIRAGRGKNGQGSAKGGTRGDDVVITVPVGTIVRELDRHDPAADEALSIKAYRAALKQHSREQRLAREERERAKAVDRDSSEAMPQNPHGDEDASSSSSLQLEDPSRDKWLLYAGMSKGEMKASSFPRLPRRRRNMEQPPGPIYLDLSRPTPRPILLATGGMGGLGNPHFTSKEHPRPLFATKGDDAVTMKIELELKLLADIGLVGLPNAGKSTLLRALTNSRTRVGHWAFTTLQPNIGTVVLDQYSGRPGVKSSRTSSPPGLADHGRYNARTRFTIADIPGLIEGAHLDRGLGSAFLRHVERAGVLAFVLDLGAGDAAKALDALWHEVGLYARMREEEELNRQVETSGDGLDDVPVTKDDDTSSSALPPGTLQIAGKPWFVVATKADLPDTQDNFRELEAYLGRISRGEAPHPSGSEPGWTRDLAAIPVSAINGQGVGRIVQWAAGLLDE